jgi:hypothetical protein
LLAILVPVWKPRAANVIGESGLWDFEEEGLRGFFLFDRSLRVTGVTDAEKLIKTQN